MPKMSKEFDYKKLIELVKEREFLYNPLHEDHRDLSAATVAWKSIGEALGVSADEAKKKWWSKKDNYRRHKIATLRHDQATSWRWWKQLRFLDHYFEEKDNRSPRGRPVKHIDCRPPDLMDIPVALTDGNLPFSVKPDPTLLDASDSGSGMADTWPQSEDSLPVEHTVDTEPTTVRAYNQSHTSAMEDADDLFMRSCLMHLKRLPERSRMETKMEILNLLYRKQYGDE